MRTAAAAPLAAAVVLAALAASCAGTRPTAGPAEARDSPAATARQVMAILPAAAEESLVATARDLAARHRLDPVYAWALSSLGGAGCVVFTVPDWRSPEEVAGILAGEPGVSSAQPNHLYRVLATAPYDDPYYELQHAASRLRLAEAQRHATGSGVRVAVIDTGLDLAHPDLGGRIAEAGNFVDRGAGSFTSDVHGTAVAGVIAARPNNAIGIVGVAPGASLHALKACWAETAGSRGAQCNSYTLAKALDAAVAAGAQVLNLSLTGPEDPLLARLVAGALARGIAVVAAADVDRADGGFPARLPGVLAVTAAAGTPAGALSAPGNEILSTTPGGEYDFFSGSSFSAAHATGVAALVLERAPGLSPAQLADLLRASTTLGEDGSATLDACKALRAAGADC